MRRGDVYWCDLGPTVPPHPVVLLSRDSSYRARRRATVALVTSTVRGLPIEIALGQANGLQDGSVVNVDEIYTVRTDQLRERMGALDAQQLGQLGAALRFALAL